MTLLTVVACVAVAAHARPRVARSELGGDADPVTLERIMADPEWLGSAPEGAYWAEDGQTVLFLQKRPGESTRSLFEIDATGGEPREVPIGELGAVDFGGGRLSHDGSYKVYAREGDVYVHDFTTGARQQITRTAEEERDPWPLAHGRVSYRRGTRLLVRDLSSGLEEEPFVLLLEDDPEEVEREREVKGAFLADRQGRLFEVLQQSRREKEASRRRELEERREDPTRVAPPWYLGEGVEIRRLALSPDGRWLVLSTARKLEAPPSSTAVPRYVTESGEVTTDVGRPKVGALELFPETFWLFDRSSHRRVELDLSPLPGIDLDPLADLRASARAAEQEEPALRTVESRDFLWSGDSERVVLQLFSLDSKDRWIAEVDLESARLVPVQHMQDRAWINWIYRDIGWLPDGETLFYLSEESGYSRLYLHDLAAGSRRAVTADGYEVAGPTLSRDGAFVYFTANREHPGVWEVYRVAVASGHLERMTRLGGNTSFELSPDGGRLLLTHSTATRPPELFVQPAEPGARAVQLTHTISSEFLRLPWVDPEIVKIPSSHVDQPIYARLYLPQDNAESGLRPAVLFVHGAGYIQNAQRGWMSYYAREFMFNTLLVRRGYVVLEMDYRASQGYGRDWRTATYRQMGGPELEDLEDGVEWLVRTQRVDRDHIGLYGSSYGGFLTLMALFKRPRLFAAGAALSPVTDWAHYNHPWTSDILNTPDVDPEAFRRSSPIEFAAGLERPLLICHGMVDPNVHFQDTVQLAQRLIELGKQDWEVAIYPLERHAFEHASSWLDEYRRILELFERNLRSGK